MFKVLIVDDEALICEGMKSKLERLAIQDMGEILVAGSGAQALEILGREKPAVMITDIRMEGMSGLELVREAVRLLPELRCVILSGYDEFQYAKDALRLGVVDYLLKPAAMEELREVLDKVTAELDAKEQQRLAQQRVSRREDDAAREQMLTRLMFGSWPEGGETPDMPDQFSTFFPYRYFCVGLFLPGQGTPDVQSFHAAAREATATWSESGPDRTGYLFPDMKGNLVFIGNLETEKGYGDLLDHMDAVTRQARESADGVCVAVSEVWAGGGCLPHLYRQAVKASAYRLIHPDDRCYTYAMHQRRSTEIPSISRQLSGIRDELMMSRPEKASEIVDSLFDSELLANRTVDVIRSMYVMVMQGMYGVLAERAPARAIEDIPPFDGFLSVEQMRVTVKRFLFLASGVIREAEKDKSLEQLARGIIHKNRYRDLEMAQVANATSMSYSYFSRQFKLQTGMNFTAFLIKVRMEEAVRLLDDPNLRIYEVSDRVGYENPKHFTRTFSRYYGMSPADYRKRMNR